MSEQGFYINSGLAHGIDEAAHRAALTASRDDCSDGRLDWIEPIQHNINHYAAKSLSMVVQSSAEFLPDTVPLQHHFPRRNRIVSGLSLGVIVAEAALKSGSLITAKLAAEQGKTVFAIPGRIYSEHHQGCHQLIREGAILIDHPQQVIEELALATQWQALENTPKLESLQQNHNRSHHIYSSSYNQLDWVGQSLDQLGNAGAARSICFDQPTHGTGVTRFCTQQAGLYLRCRILK